MKIVIGVCFTETKHPNYPAWILEGSDAVEVVDLSWEKQNLEDLDKCHGLLLTGGIDIDPAYYDQSLKTYPNQPAIWNTSRDEFEFDLLNKAQTLKMPILGICRGLQLINVALGGSLIVDLEHAGEKNHRNMGGIDYIHTVELQKDSLLAAVSGISNGKVNSAHHQAIEQISDLLSIGCYSDDGLIEGIEWKDKADKSPMLAVQWHPERIENKQTNPLSQNLKAWFFEEALKFKS